MSDFRAQGDWEMIELFEKQEKEYRKYKMKQCQSCETKEEDYESKLMKQKDGKYLCDSCLTKRLRDKCIKYKELADIYYGNLNK
jgi:hypothetical protein